jgi:hypothetical protein
MKPSCLKPFLRSLGLAIASIFSFCTLAIAQPFPSATVWIAQTPTEQPAPSNPLAQPAPRSDLVTSPDEILPSKQAQTSQTSKNEAKAIPESKQGQSGGPYDLKTIEESYRSLYGS